MSISKLKCSIRSENSKKTQTKQLQKHLPTHSTQYIGRFFFLEVKKTLDLVHNEELVQQEVQSNLLLLQLSLEC